MRIKGFIRSEYAFLANGGALTILAVKQLKLRVFAISRF
jgi:hypothetical protein